MRRFYLFFTTIIVMVSGWIAPAQCDVWIPPVGELISDSVFVNLFFSDGSVTVEIRTVHCMGKLVSDDYTFEFSRSGTEGRMNPDLTSISFSDSLGQVISNPDLLRFSGVSFSSIEDTLTVEVVTQHTFSGEQSLDELLLLRHFCRDLFDELEWYDFIPALSGNPGWVSIISNESVTASWSADNIWPGGWQEGGTGDRLEFVIDPQHWDLFDLGLKLEFDNDDQIMVREMIADTLEYVLAPEVRAETPGLIRTEDVRINLSSYGIPEDYYHYYQYANIELNTGLAVSLAPMWLWYPNDITDAEVLMEGIKSYQYWGYYQERFERDSLRIVRVEEEGKQNGFYIYVPKMDNTWVGQEDWWWSEAHICVEISGNHYGESARFIVITAPTEPSTIRFTISGELEFNNWTNPFEEVEHVQGWQHRSILFTGNCAEPGEALVHWQPLSAPTDRVVIPADYNVSAYPNPFNSTTIIACNMPQPGTASLTIRDITGRVVDVLVDEYMSTGIHKVNWNPIDLATGVYFCRFEAGSSVKIMKLALVR